MSDCSFLINSDFSFVPFLNRQSCPKSLTLDMETGLSSHVLIDLAPLYCMLDLKKSKDGDSVPETLKQACKHSSAALVQKVSVRLKLALRANSSFRHSTLVYYLNMLHVIHVHVHDSCALLHNAFSLSL
jgi:hypothetical protein